MVINPKQILKNQFPALTDAELDNPDDLRNDLRVVLYVIHYFRPPVFWDMLDNDGMKYINKIVS